ncbi:receptor-type tyrosine-protein phosphatase eta-like, partial [Gigantopelta aegis]|uniref:receptor-type tyrosine-protein phosphatase eta-like n=1 Tax=Gigantopelta aegis TaxID=1735272 RepID=UPI001B88E0C6
ITSCAVLNGDCTTADCTVTNSFCDSSICQCNDTFYKNGSQCEPIISLQVTDLRLQSSTLNSLTVNWNPPSDTTPDYKYVVTWTPDPGSADVTKGTNMKEITGLQSGTEYSITVTTHLTYRTQQTAPPLFTAKTKYTFGQACQATSECGESNTDCSSDDNTANVCRCAAGFYRTTTTCTSITSLQVTDLRLQSSTLNSLTVNWNPPSDTTADYKYVVTWTSGPGSADVTKGTNMKEITGLQPGTEYSITVTTHITYRTQKTAPPLFTAKTKYTFGQACQATSECGEPNTDCSSDDNTANVCRCADGFYRTTTTCTSIISLQVTDLRLQSSTLNSLTVNWKPPLDTTADYKYVVTWTSGPGSADVTKGTNMKEITGLQPGTEYFITVTTHITYRTQQTAPPLFTAKTKDKVGQPCYNTSDCGEPNTDCSSDNNAAKVCRCAAGFYRTTTSCTSITNLKVTDLELQMSTHNSLTVNWQPPRDTTPDFKYVVTWTPGDGRTDVTKGTNMKKITGLQPGTEYAITVTTHITYRTQQTAPPLLTAKT